MLKAKIDNKSALNALERYPDILSKETRLALKKTLTTIQREARKQHRFNTQSGNLERSVSIEVDRSGFFGRIFIDMGIAVYGRRIHEGFKSWTADKFIYKAAERKAKDFIKNISTAIGRAINKSGLR